VLGRDVGTTQAKPEDRTRAAPRIELDQTAAVTPEVNGGIMLGAIRIEGNATIPSSAFAPLIESYIGLQADTQKLQALARSVADLARARGYIFASAMIPPQSVDNGIVSVQLDEGSVNQIRVSGSSNGRLAAILNKIVGTGVQKSLVERQLLLAEDLPGIRVKNARFIREGNQAVLAVDVREDRHNGAIAIDNYGPPNIGPVRFILRYEMAGLLGDDDTLTFQGLVTPVRPRELAYGSLRYARSIGTNGAQLGIAGAVGSIRPDNTSGNVTGNSRYFAVFANQPLWRTRRTSVWLNGEFAYLSVNQSANDLAAQRDRIATLSFALSGSTILANGRLSGGVGIVQGLNAMGATTSGDPLASRRDASGSFTKGQFWLNWTGTIADHLTLQLAANGQLASAPLLASQELGLGGPSFGRGYDFNERSGDSGILGLAELRRQFDRPIQGVDWIQLYGFVDGGQVSNLAGGLGGGSLLSSGGGVRAALGRVELGVEAAVPISQVRRKNNAKRAKLNMSVGLNF
jgi:hemolysin activation/secretion protein